MHLEIWQPQGRGPRTPRASQALAELDPVTQRRVPSPLRLTLSRMGEGGELAGNLTRTGSSYTSSDT